MSSHNILTGFWKKKKWDPKSLFHFLHEITPAQLSFAMEVVSQNLGKKPSKYWGHQKINIKLPQSKEALEFFLESCTKPKHIMSKRLSEHKEAAGVASAIGEAVVRGGRAVGRVVARGARYLAAHASQIVKGVGTALQLGATGVQIAASVGLLDPETDSTLIALANITNQIAGQYQTNVDEQKEAKDAEDADPDSKKGSAFDTEVFKGAIKWQKEHQVDVSKQKKATIHTRGYLRRNPFLHIS